MEIEKFFHKEAERKEKVGDYKGALEEYDKAIELANNPISYIYKAGVYNEMGNDDAVLECLNNALAIDENFPHAYINRALYYRHHKNYEAAQRDYETTIALEVGGFNIVLFNEEDIFKYAELSEIANPEKSFTYFEGELEFSVYLSAYKSKENEPDTFLTKGVKDMPYFFIYKLYPKAIYNQKLMWFQYRIAKQIFKFKTYVLGMKVRPLRSNVPDETPLLKKIREMAEKADDEIKEKLISRYKELDSITIRLLEVMRKYPNYFMQLLCYFYPFTKEQLKRHQNLLLSSCWHYTVYFYNNFFISWDEELLMEFKDKWSWNLVASNILSRDGVASPDFIFKIYEMGLINANDIFEIHTNCFDSDNNYIIDDCSSFCDIESFYECYPKLYQFILRDKKLEVKMNEIVNEKINKSFEELEELYPTTSEPYCNTIEEVGSLAKSIYEDLKTRYESNLNQPKELEQIVSFLEREGKILDVTGYISRELTACKEADPFFCDNPLKIGFDYTFNTPEKRKILDDAVETFLIEQSLNKAN